MLPVWILLVGMAIVVGGVLVLRLHAFLALTLAAIAVALLTPLENRRAYEVRQVAIEVLRVFEDGRTVALASGPDDGIQPGERLLLLRSGEEVTRLRPVGQLQIQRFQKSPDAAAEHAVAVLEASSEEVKAIAADDVVVHPLMLKRARDRAGETVGERVAGGFGSTCGKIGILIAMAAIIGKCLLESGAADRIVRSALKLFGQRGAPAGFLFSGFLLGIPVFFDTVFYLMIPLGKAMRVRTGRNYLLYVLSIVAGGTMAHSLVPPTPGPLLVAGELNVDMGLMIIAGILVGLFTSTAGFLFALLVNSRGELPLRESPDLSLAELQLLADREESSLPPLWLALTPILLPVLLIGSQTVVDAVAVQLPPAVAVAMETLGNKNIALALAAAIAVVMLLWQCRASLADLADSLSGALASGGIIILITAAGGAFGSTIQQTGVASLVRELPQAMPLMVLVFAFLITTAVRTAQGSATVAMITAVGILAGFARSDLGFHPVYLALAIGCGSKPIAWMNDSGFWVICKMSGMTEAEGLRYITPMSILMGAVGLIVVLAGAWMWPLV